MNRTVNKSQVLATSDRHIEDEVRPRNTELFPGARSRRCLMINGMLTFGATLYGTEHMY